MKSNMFVRGAPMRCPKGTAARVRSWRRDIVLARIFIQMPFRAGPALAGAGAKTARSRQRIAGAGSQAARQPAANSQPANYRTTGADIGADANSDADDETLASG